jgi:septal ring factor EnvC (AmiA/AmiB activator)
MEVINKEGASHKIDLEALNQVNAEIRWHERKIDENLDERRKLDVKRKHLRNEIIDLRIKRRKIIFDTEER